MNRGEAYADPLALGRRLKEKLAGGGTCAGAFLKIPSPDMVEVFAGTDLDFVIADAEHGPISPESCQAMVRAGDAAGLPVLARIGEANVAGTVTRFLDTGIGGVHLPRIDSVVDALAQFELLFHPPHGIRGLAGGRWARYGKVAPLPQLLDSLPASLVVVVQIESRTALDNLDQLLSLPVPDVYFIGPTDLAASLGFRGDKDDVRVVDEVDGAIASITAAGRTAGVIAGSAAEVERYCRAGVRYFVFNGEALAQAGAAGVLAGISQGTQ